MRQGDREVGRERRGEKLPGVAHVSQGVGKRESNALDALMRLLLAATVR